MDDFEYIRSKLGEDELLAQLAEEAAELAQAALKLRRAMGGAVNPSPVLLRHAELDLRAELADVNVCVRALGLSFGDRDVMEVFAEKRTRWRKRLEGAEK